tara:strand:- start:12 stop:293 length:282 start_codon:yes stop_codon:yes gene_type:complete
VNLVARQDLSVGLLQSLHTSQKVPETGSGVRGIRGEDAHTEELRGGVSLSRLRPPNNLKFSEGLRERSKVRIIPSTFNQKSILSIISTTRVNY